MRYLALSLSVLVVGFSLIACPEENNNNNNSQDPTACELLEAAETAAASSVCADSPDCRFCDCFASGSKLLVTEDGTELSFACVPWSCDATAAMECADATDMCEPLLVEDASSLCEISTSDASDASPL